MTEPVTSAGGHGRSEARSCANTPTRSPRPHPIPHCHLPVVRPNGHPAPRPACRKPAFCASRRYWCSYLSPDPPYGAECRPAPFPGRSSCLRASPRGVPKMCAGGSRNRGHGSCLQRPSPSGSGPADRTGSQVYRPPAIPPHLWKRTSPAFSVLRLAAPLGVGPTTTVRGSF